MKVFGFLVVLLVIVSVLTCFVFSGKGNTFKFQDMLTRHGDATVAIVKSRKLKDNRGDAGSSSIHLEDYRPIDPVPSSKASIRPGPIQHGTPLMPYIPKPAPTPPPRGDPNH